MVGPNHGPTMFHMATVSHKRWDPCILYRTSLTSIMVHGVQQLKCPKLFVLFCRCTRGSVYCFGGFLIIAACVMFLFLCMDIAMYMETSDWLEGECQTVNTQFYLFLTQDVRIFETVVHRIQWWRDLFRCRIDLLNFSMGFNNIAPYMVCVTHK